VPGGVARPLAPETRRAIRSELPGALGAAERAISWWEAEEPRHAEEAESCGNFPTAFLALVGSDGSLSFDGGRLRLVSADGQVLEDGLDPSRYGEFIDERADGSSYLKPAHWRSMGLPAGAYRVGPLARLNVVSGCGTPRADRALARLRGKARAPLLSTFRAHRARLVEILYALERMEELLDDPALLGQDVLATPGERLHEGVGVCEAPRGTLFHRYRVDDDGLVTGVDLLIASAQNALSMDRAVHQAASRWLDGARITPALLNRVEAAIRAFDPCLSCATHAHGESWVSLRLLGPGGEVIDERR
jgi:NAD-reducing hydrogenase large subunit